MLAVDAGSSRSGYSGSCPATNAAVQDCGLLFNKRVHKLPPKAVLDEIDAKVDMQQLEETLMREGLAAFADPHKALIKLIAEKRQSR